MVVRTPSQTVGPFFHVGLKWESGEQAQFASQGETITLTGRVFDGAGSLVADALVETWQADPAGRVPAEGTGEHVHGYARSGTDGEGRFMIRTRMPGACSGPKGESYAPQLHVTIFARGLLKALRTRVFLAAPEALKEDPLALAAGTRVTTLVATKAAKAPSTWCWDIRFQGRDETVFIEA